MGYFSDLNIQMQSDEIAARYQLEDWYNDIEEPDDSDEYENA